MIRAGEIDGVMFVSAEPDKINHQSFQAAIDTGLPLAGTGGSSVAKVQSMGGKVLSASGHHRYNKPDQSVAFTTAFAKEWNIRYQPVIGIRELTRRKLCRQTSGGGSISAGS